MESSTEHPQRLSALYQYHNAPEVAPAHGLEYDDSTYPSSDKYPVIHNTPAYDSKYTGQHVGSRDTKPPRIIFGMKVPTFLIVAAIMIMVIVGAAVGGAVGGSSIRSDTTGVATNATSTSASTTATASSVAASSYAAPTPTFSPIADCPQSNNTLYTSSFASGSSGTVPTHAGLNYTRYCNVANPITSTNTLSTAFVYSFEDCIEVCAALNFYAAGDNCSVAAYQPTASRPSNCWVGSQHTTFGNLTASQGVDVALLDL